MIRLFFALIVFLTGISPVASAVDGIRCEMALYQTDSETQKNVLLLVDTVDFLKGLNTAGYVGPFAFDVELTDADTIQANLRLQVVTLGPPANTYSRTYAVEYTLPARLSGIEGKNGALYSFVLTPQSKAEIDTSGCSFQHQAKSEFVSQPSAYMDIYYLTATLGDFHRYAVRDALEEHFRRFREFANLNLPGKGFVYLCPCPIRSVVWDKRYGMMVDPVRNLSFCLYNRGLSTADPFVVIHTAVLRQFGYTAPFISEGLANYVSYNWADMKTILKDKANLPLATLVEPYNYRRSDPYVADRTSASFVKFLVDQYGYDRLMNCYKAADDLNLKTTLEKTYEKPVAELEREWKNYCDTLSLSSNFYIKYAEFNEYMVDFTSMVKYGKSALQLAQNTKDSTKAAQLLKRAYFFNGNYYGASDMSLLLIKLDSNSAGDWMSLGAYEMMNGYYDDALAHITRAREIDSTGNTIKFSLALNYLCRGDSAAAQKILENNFSGEKGAQAQAETRVYLANLLAQKKDSTSQAHARDLYRRTVSDMEQVLGFNSSSSASYLWLGVARIGLNDLATGISTLHVAEFLETRPFYSGMIALWLGKAYRASGDLETARAYFGQVLALPSAVYSRQEAQQYLEQM